jgi:hypothetical protein
MRERSKATIENRTRPGRLPCERFQPNEPERYWLGTFGLLNQALAFEVKNPLYFSCCFTGTPSSLPAAVACYAKNADPEKRTVLAK